MNLLVSEEGKISFVTVIVVMIFIMLIGLVANSGKAVVEKIELQNAADSTAYSIALCHARAMNAVTTTNHLMGEMTALIVLMNSLGGEQHLAGAGYAIPSKRNAINGEIEKIFSDATPVAGLGTAQRVAEKTIDPVDRQLTRFIEQHITSEHNKYVAGGAFYDGQLTLRYCMLVCLATKKLANRGGAVATAIRAIPVVGTAVAEGIQWACFAAHAFATRGLVLVCMEWAYLQAAEQATRILGPVKATLERAIPLVSVYADGLVRDFGTATELHHQHLQQWYASNYGVSIEAFPKMNKISLPVQPEKFPQDSTTVGMPPSRWSKDDGKKYRYDEILKPYVTIEKVFDDVAELVERATKTPWTDGVDLRWTYELFLTRTKEWKPQNKMPKEREHDYGYGYPHNPAYQDFAEIDWEAEQYSQWVRATYPYVDSFRAPIRGWLDDPNTCKISSASTYFVNWTNRYTLAVSHDLRRPKTSGPGGSSSWQQGPLASILPFRTKIDELHQRFTKALNVEGDLEDASSPVMSRVTAISDQLDAFVRGGLDPEIIAALKQLGVDVNGWINGVLSHKHQIENLNVRLGNSTDLDIDEESMKQFAKDVALIAALEELLKILAEVVAKIDQFLDPLSGTPHMYVMQEMDADKKGAEPWATSSRLAERYFTVVGFAYREPQHLKDSLLFEPLFQNQHPKGAIAYSQAMFYNAGGRHLGGKARLDGKQPNTGWDTLNWKTPVKAPEWGGDDPSGGGEAGWDIFWRSRTVTESVPSFVRLNWQAKLVPVTSSRLSDAANDNSLPVAVGDAVGYSEKRDRLITH